MVTLSEARSQLAGAKARLKQQAETIKGVQLPERTRRELMRATPLSQVRFKAAQPGRQAELELKKTGALVKVSEAEKKLEKFEKDVLAPAEAEQARRQYEYEQALARERRRREKYNRNLRAYQKKKKEQQANVKGEKWDWSGTVTEIDKDYKPVKGTTRHIYKGIEVPKSFYEKNIQAPKPVQVTTELPETITTTELLPSKIEAPTPPPKPQYKSSFSDVMDVISIPSSYIVGKGAEAYAKILGEDKVAKKIEEDRKKQFEEDVAKIPDVVSDIGTFAKPKLEKVYDVIPAKEFVADIKVPSPKKAGIGVTTVGLAALTSYARYPDMTAEQRKLFVRDVTIKTGKEFGYDNILEGPAIEEQKLGKISQDVGKFFEAGRGIVKSSQEQMWTDVGKSVAKVTGDETNIQVGQTIGKGAGKAFQFVPELGALYVAPTTVLSAEVLSSTQSIKEVEQEVQNIRDTQVDQIMSDIQAGRVEIPEGYRAPTREEVRADVLENTQNLEADLISAYKVKGGLAGTFLIGMGAAKTYQLYKSATKPIVYQKTLMPQGQTSYKDPLITVKQTKTMVGKDWTGGLFQVKGTAKTAHLGQQTIVTQPWRQFTGYRPIYSGVPYGAGRPGYQKAIKLLTKSTEKGGYYGLSSYKAKEVLRYRKPFEIQKSFTGKGMILQTPKGTQLGLKYQARTDYLSVKRPSRIEKGFAVGEPKTYSKAMSKKIYTVKDLKKLKVEGVEWLKVGTKGKAIKDMPILSKGFKTKEFVTTTYKGKIPEVSIIKSTKYPSGKLNINIESYMKSKLYTGTSFSRQLKPVAKRSLQFSGKSDIVVAKTKVPITKSKLDYKTLFPKQKGLTYKVVDKPLIVKAGKVSRAKKLLTSKKAQVNFMAPRTTTPSTTIYDIKPQVKITGGQYLGGAGVGLLQPDTYAKTALTPLSVSKDLTVIKPQIFVTDIQATQVKLRVDQVVIDDQPQIPEQPPIVIGEAPLKLDQQPIQTFIQPEVQKTPQVPKQQPLLKTQPKIRFQPKLKTKVGVRQRPRPPKPKLKPRPTKGLKIPLPPTDILAEEDVGKRKKKERYAPFVKRYGVWKPYGKATTRRTAIRRGVGILRETLGASLKVVGVRTKKPVRFVKETKEFRFGKAGPTVLVQRKTKRIKALGEKMEIIRAQRGVKFI